MCFILVGVETLSDAPLAWAANREEFFTRPTIAPRLELGPPRVLCGTDARAGGTWMGVNEHGLMVAVTNRYDRPAPDRATSRGILCRQTLNQKSIEGAASFATAEISSDRYAGVNVLIGSSRRALVIHGGTRRDVVELNPGYHVLTNFNVDDPEDHRQLWARAEMERMMPNDALSFLESARKVCSSVFDPDERCGVVLRGSDRGTVSSQIGTLAARSADCRFLYSAGSPDLAPYDDLSALFPGR